MTEYADLDRELTAANLARAHAWVEVMGEWTPEAAEVAEQAWEVCQHVGERYLEARYEHEAEQAGFDITPPVVEDEFDPVANEIDSLRNSIVHCEAMLKIFEDPHSALDIILNAEDDHEACRALSEHFDISEDQASTALLNLGGAGTISHRRGIAVALGEAVARLQQMGA